MKNIANCDQCRKDFNITDPGTSLIVVPEEELTSLEEKFHCTECTLFFGAPRSEQRYAGEVRSFVMMSFGQSSITRYLNPRFNKTENDQ